MPLRRERRLWREALRHFDRHDDLPPETWAFLTRARGQDVDAREAASVSILLGCARSETQITFMLEHLGCAWKSFATTKLQRLRLRREAARHLLAAGYAREALTSVDAIEVDGEAGPEFALTCQALGALARVDLGEASPSARDVSVLVPAARRLAPQLSPRDRAWLVSDLLQVLLAQFWRASESRFALGSRMAATDLGSPNDLHTRLLEVLTWVAAPDLPASHEVHILCALANFAVDTARGAFPARLLLQALRAPPVSTAQHWTWLGLGNQLAQNVSAAVDCHRRALVLAQQSGAHRAALLSNAELGSLLADQGDFRGAYEALRWCRAQESRLQAQSDLPMGSRWFDVSGGFCTLDPLDPPLEGAASVHVQRARHYIEAHLSKQLRTCAVASACGISRRTLETAFRSHAGCSVAEHIRRSRVDRIATLLRQPGNSVDSVAADLGYASAAALRRDFRLHTGQSVTALCRGTGPREERGGVE